MKSGLDKEMYPIFPQSPITKSRYQSQFSRISIPYFFYEKLSASFQLPDLTSSSPRAIVFYTMKLNILYNEDCLEGMKKRLPDKSIDLTVTSPPYDNLRTYRGYDFDFEPIAQQLYRVTKDGGVVVWVVGDATINGSETGTSFRQALYFKELGFNLHDTMIYRKRGGLMTGSLKCYVQKFEYMFVFSKSTIKTVNIIKDKPVKYTESRTKKHRKIDGTFDIQEWKCGGLGRRENIWTYDVGLHKTTKDKIAFEHPAIFPDKLAEDHILSWSNKNDVVLDPLCGSGTTLKMARKHQRYYIGFEMSSKYCEVARRRLAQLQLI